MTVTVIEHITLDGVMQAPLGPGRRVPMAPVCCTGRCRWTGSSPDRDEADACWASFLREAKSKEELR